MPAKKLSKAEQEKLDAAAAAEKAALEQQAAEAAAAQTSLDSLLAPDPTLIVPMHDDADIAAVLQYHFHHLYHPKPPPAAAAPQPAAVDTKEQSSPAQPARGAAKSTAKVSSGKPASKRQASVVPVEPPAPVVQTVVQPVGRAADHPISVLESAWKIDNERYRTMESGLLAASAAYSAQQQQMAAQLQSLSLLPTVDFPHPPAIPPSPAADLESGERLLNLSALTSSVMAELLSRQRPIVRRMPDVVKRPSTRGGSAQRIEEERKEQLVAVKAKHSGQRKVGKASVRLSDRQLVQRELNRIALAPSQLETEQRLLQRMREKQRYLANPRSQTSAQHQPPHKRHGTRGLEADVTDIRFLRYECGMRYERSVRLTNSSRVTQRLSISQPGVGSPFAYTLSSTAAATSLAPGMSVSVLVSFAPQSLSAVAAALVVQTEHSTLHIPVVAQRLPSPLSLPPVITLPACLLQRTALHRIEVRNEGLRSSFRLLASDAVAALERLPPIDELPSTLQLSDVMQVYPAVFELDEDECITLTFTFAPTAANVASASSSPLTADVAAQLLYRYSSMLAVVTDDGAASYHAVSAEACELALQLVGPTQQVAGSPQRLTSRAPFLFGIEQLALKTAPTAESAISTECGSTDRLLFPTTLLGSSSAVSLTLRNLSPVSLPFQWLTPFDDRYSSLLPVFHCYPFNGTLHGYEEREMVVTFTPREPQSYTHSLQLLCNEPGHMDLSVAEMAVEGQGRVGRLSMAVERAAETRTVARGEWEVWQLRLTNVESEDVDIEYDVVAVVVSGCVDATRVQLWPSQGRLSGGSSRLVSVNVQSDECGAVVIDVELAIHPVGLSSSLRLTANVVEPSMAADAVDVEATAQEEQSAAEQFSLHDDNIPAQLGEQTAPTSTIDSAA